MNKATGNLEIKIWNSPESEASFKMQESKTIQEQYSKGYNSGYEQGHNSFNIGYASLTLSVGLALGILSYKIFRKKKKQTSLMV